jgi:hypothetical protein
MVLMLLISLVVSIWANHPFVLLFIGHMYSLYETLNLCKWYIYKIFVGNFVDYSETL